MFGNELVRPTPSKEFTLFYLQYWNYIIFYKSTQIYFNIYLSNKSTMDLIMPTE